MLRNIILFTFFLICLSIKLVPALVDVNIDQSMENSGFHRLLTTNITLYGNLTSCKLLLTEKLPRNVFVPENDLDVINEYSEVHVKLSDKINVEKTATESVPFVAYIFLNKSQPVVTSNEFHTTYLYVIPLRIRYHDPKTEGGVREFKKPPVTLYGFCPQGLNLPKGSIEELPCDPHSLEKCKWTSLPVKQTKLLPPLVVPVGNTDHFHYVFISTHVSAYLGLLYIICSLFLVK